MWDEINTLGIVPAQQIIYVEAPCRMHKLISFEIPFNIKGKIDPEIVGYPELVTGIVVNVGNIVDII
jgi:hypothetical protein